MDISCYSTTSTIEILMASIMIITVLSVFIRSMINYNKKRGKGIGARIVQFTCLCLIIPTIIILSLENIIKGETVATIIGGLIGYVLSGVGDYIPANSQKQPENKSKSNAESV